MISTIVTSDRFVPGVPDVDKWDKWIKSAQPLQFR